MNNGNGDLPQGASNESSVPSSGASSAAHPPHASSTTGEDRLDAYLRMDAHRRALERGEAPADVRPTGHPSIDPYAFEKRKKLFKSRGERKLFGVCGGLAAYFDIDPSLVRILFVLGVVFGWGSFLVIYLVLTLVLQDEPVRIQTPRITP